MFNFSSTNKAVKDFELSDKAFRMLYLITNLCSKNNSNSIEIHNAHFMMMLNVSERWVRKLSNELVEKGYINKEIQGTSKNKLANKYTLIEVSSNECTKVPPYNENESDTQKCAQKFPLNNNNKIYNKNNILINNTSISNTDIDNIISEDKNNILINNTSITPTNVDVTTSDNVSFNVNSEIDNFNNIEVCDLSEQREDNKTNVIEIRNNEIKNEIVTSTIVEDTTITNDKNKVNTTSTNVEGDNLTYEDYLNSQRELYNEVVFGDSVTVDTPNTNDNFKVNNKKFQYHYDTLLVYIADWKRYHTSKSADEVYEQFGNIKVMFDYKRITEKQYNLALCHFKGFCKMEDNFNEWNKNAAPNEINPKSSAPAPDTDENKAILSHSNGKDDNLIISDIKTRENANKTANLAYIESVCNETNKSINISVIDDVIKQLNKAAISIESKQEYINRYFNNVQHKFPEYVEIVKNKYLKLIA